MNSQAPIKSGGNASSQSAGKSAAKTTRSRNSTVADNNPQSHWINSNGVRLHAVTRGDSSRTPIVLVHGYPDNHSVWNGVAEILAQSWYVIAYDVRGAGQSDRPTRIADYRMNILSQDLGAVVDALIPARNFHLVGHDWGSIQSWESVTSGPLPERILSYTSISGPCLDHMGFWMRNHFSSGTVADTRKAIRQLLSSWYVMMFQLPLLAPTLWRARGGRWWSQYLEQREGVTEVEPNPTQSEDGRFGVQLYRANFIPKLMRPEPRHARCPVQVIVPTGDNYVGTQLFSELHQWVERLYRRDFNATHWVVLSQPDRIAAWIEDFVRSVDAGEDTPALAQARVRPERVQLPLAGRVAVITGAGSGIGRSTALKLAREGADIVCADIDADSAARTQQLCELLGARAWAKTVDVGAANEMEALAQWVERELGGATILVNNAGIGMAGGVLDTSPAQWEKLLKVNLWGVIHGSRLFARQMIERQQNGQIINVASAAAFAPNRKLAAYSTSKAAVHMLSECLRGELADSNIGVTAVCPGFVATGIANATVYAGLSETEQAEKRARADAMYKRRNFSPDTVADAIFDAVQRNPAIALVGAEAWGTRLLSRFAPALSRRIARVDITP